MTFDRWEIKHYTYLLKWHAVSHFTDISPTRKCYRDVVSVSRRSRDVLTSRLGLGWKGLVHIPEMLWRVTYMIDWLFLPWMLCMFSYRYCKRNASCHSRQHHHPYSFSRRIDDDDSSFQTLRGADYSPLPPPPPPEYVSSHHWHRHRHRASNERLAMKRVQDWLSSSRTDDTLRTPPGELDRQHDDDILVLHEHCCRRYYLQRQ